jgi:hypothetical protein
MQICGGEIAWVTWKPGDLHGSSIIAPQPLPCGVLPYWEEPWGEPIEQSSDFPVMPLRTMQPIPYNQAPKGEMLLDPQRGRKMIK